MHRTHRTLLALAHTALLAACSGGGGGDGGGPTLPMPTATLTSSTAPIIASAVVGAVTDSQYIGDLGGLAVPTSAASGGITIARVDLDAPPALAAALGAVEQPCAVAGTAAFSAMIANAGTLTDGDSFTFTFTACDQGDGVILDGGYSFAVTTLQGDVPSGMIRLTITVTLDDLSFFKGGETTTMAGDLSLTIDTLTNTLVISTEVSGDSLSVASAAGAASLTNYSIVLTVDPLGGTATFAVDAFVESSAFNGRVEIATTTPLVLDASDVPSDGEIVIEGAGGATITIDVVSVDQVDLLIDLDGNGTIDEVISTTWSALLE